MHVWTPLQPLNGEKDGIIMTITWSFLFMCSFYFMCFMTNESKSIWFRFNLNVDIKCNKKNLSFYWFWFISYFVDLFCTYMHFHFFFPVFVSVMIEFTTHSFPAQNPFDSIRRDYVFFNFSSFWFLDLFTFNMHAILLNKKNIYLLLPSFTLTISFFQMILKGKMKMQLFCCSSLN